MARKKSAEELEDEEGGMDTVDYGEEPDFSDPEDFVDNITDEVSAQFFFIITQQCCGSESGRIQILVLRKYVADT
jgi:hypothetical protein